MKPAELKQCRQCEKLFRPWSTTQTVCGRLCAGRLVKEQKKAEIATTRARKQALKTIPQLIKEAQHAFNAFVRERDKDQPCICCGAGLRGVSGSTGGDFDCGHYRSVGSAPHLRFDERNAHGQRKVCNRWGAGRAVDYRIGLIRRIGLAAVDALEADNRVHKWTREELITVREYYKTKLKALQAERTE